MPPHKHTHPKQALQAYIIVILEILDAMTLQMMPKLNNLSR